MPPEHRPGPEEYLPEEYSLDELAKGLASATLSRGRALKFAGAVLLGGAFGIFGLTAPAEARRRRSCFPCNTSDRVSYPEGYCCLAQSGGTFGCLVPESVCTNPPSGTECTCGCPPPTSTCPGPGFCRDEATGCPVCTCPPGTTCGAISNECH